jgi:hypothetical protein
LTASKPLLKVDKRHLPWVLFFLLVISGALLALWNDANGITALATAVIAGFTATLWINSSNQLVHTREIERAYLTGGDLAAYGDTDKDAVAHVSELAAERVRMAVEGGQPAPKRRHFSEIPSHIRSREVGRAVMCGRPPFRKG